MSLDMLFLFRFYNCTRHNPNKLYIIIFVDHKGLNIIPFISAPGVEEY